MKWRRDRFVLLGVLLALWGWVLWGQLGRHASGAPAPAVNPPPAEPPAGPPGDGRRDAAQGRTADEIAGPAVLEAQEHAARLPLGPDPFFPDPPRVEEKPAPAGEEPEEARAVLTSTVLGGQHPCAVINGRRFRIGERITAAMTLAMIGDGWVEVDVSGSRRKLSILRKSGAPGGARSSERAGSGSRKAEVPERKASEK
jgi:hypothetical protein